LKNWGMRPTAVEGGEQALVAIQSAYETGTPFSIVLLDNMMPGMDGFALVEQIQCHPELVGATLMMLSSTDHRENAARCRDLGVTAYMTKPIKRAELLRAILASLDAASGRNLGSAAATRRGFGPGARELHLLLAEDNAVNQKLAVRLLGKRGHSVVVARNGKEAIDALERQNFDVVLMDVQMPDMDGFEATLAIRAREQETGRHVPIVAMTAHAMKGDRERCLEAGMDGYVAKPLQPTELFAAIESLAPGCDRGVAPPTPRTESAPIFDKDAALERTAGDIELLWEIVDVFLAECPHSIAGVCKAIASNDAHTLHRVAHTLKGAVSTLGAVAAKDAAQRLENMGRADDLTGAEAAFAVLQDELRRLQQALTLFRSDLSRKPR
jgi:two-component system sensor histidine kinase/response regulator